MNLQTGTGILIENPTPDQIAQVVSDLPGQREAFVLLTCSEDTYLQALAGGEREWILEYQDRSLDQHYRCTDAHLDTAAVIDALQSYARGSEDWHCAHDWQHVQLPGRRKRGEAKKRTGSRPHRLWPVLAGIGALVLVVPFLFGLLISFDLVADPSLLISPLIAIEAMLLTIGLTFAFIWLSERRKAKIARDLAARGVRTDGIVTNVRSTVSRGEEGAFVSHYIHFCYDSAGNSISRRASVSWRTLDGVSIGDPLTVTYDPQHPRRVRTHFGHKPRRTNGVIRDKVARSKKSTLDVRPALLPALGLALASVVLLTIFDLATRKDATLRGALTAAMLCRTPIRLALWFAIALFGISLARPVVERDRALASYWDHLDPRVRIEPATGQCVVACPYCGREFLPGATRCPYCYLQVNASRWRLFWGTLIVLVAILLGTTYLAGTWPSRPSANAALLALVLAGSGIWMLFLGARELYRWRRLGNRA